MSTASSSFDLLAEPIRRWIWDKKWSALRDIQERAIPLLLNSDQDAIIAAATASGKTEAAFLPLISRAYSDAEPGRGFDLVYVSPLKALINDQFRRLEDLCERIEMPVHPWHGDVDAGKKRKARQDPRGILLITPESIESLFVNRGLEIPGLFSRVQAIVIDELHAMLDTERGMHLRSLLARIEVAVKRKVRRVGLSATLGDMELTKQYLRPGAIQDVALLESAEDRGTLKLQLRGYTVGSSASEPPDVGVENSSDDQKNHDTVSFRDAQEAAVERAIAQHVFETLRGTQNLVFAGSRNKVETYADLLGIMTKERQLPDEFFPHHGNLSRDHRHFVENRLKAAKEPTTAICTSTLELGIDIGDVEAVSQIGAPYSVSSLRQRMGRSGRRPGKPAILRLYVSEDAIDASSHPVDQLRLNLARTVAMVDLMLEGWCEPPRPNALHLSTLVHQVLSIIAERNGAKAALVYKILCDVGPFHRVDQGLFMSLLRHMGSPEIDLIVQSPDGLLLLGGRAEKIVEHYSFYSVFQTTDEYRVVSSGKTLGTIPIDMVLAPDMTIVFSGRRWRVVEVHDREKVVEVVPDQTGRPPRFGGDVGIIEDVVIERMRQTLAQDMPHRYLDQHAAELLQEARGWYERLGLSERRIIEIDETSCLLATWAGTVRNGSLTLALISHGLSVKIEDGMLEISGSDVSSVRGVLEDLANGPTPQPSELARFTAKPEREKYHSYLSEELLLRDIVSAQIDAEAVPLLAERLLEQG